MFPRQIGNFAHCASTTRPLVDTAAAGTAAIALQNWLPSF